MLKQNGIPFSLPIGGYGIGDDGTIYPNGCPEGIEGHNFPEKSGPLFTPEGWAELGITEEVDQPRPDDRYYWVHGQRPDGTWEAEPKDIESLRKSAVDQVKRQRQVALDTFPKSSGVGEVYSENLKAAQAVKGGNGASVVMRDGSNAETYLGHMAAGMGITVDQFAGYVLAENATVATKAREVEAEYVRLVYSFIPQCTFEQVQTVEGEYQVYCQARTA